MKIYTKTGDGGTTSLVGGERVAKDDLRVEAYGTVDELAAHLAVLSDCAAATGVLSDELGWIEAIQNELMTVEALLAGAHGEKGKEGASGEEGGKGEDALTAATLRLETQIDTMSADLPPFRGFTLPGGHPVVSQAHVCRTVCRRAERATITALKHYPLPASPARYLNRLSDWFYAFGRNAAKKVGVVEKISIFVL